MIFILILVLNDTYNVNASNHQNRPSTTPQRGKLHIAVGNPASKFSIAVNESTYYALWTISLFFFFWVSLQTPQLFPSSGLGDSREISLSQHLLACNPSGERRKSCKKLQEPTVLKANGLDDPYGHTQVHLQQENNKKLN